MDILVLGVDVGGSALKWALLKPDGTVTDSGAFATPATPAAVFDAVALLSLPVAAYLRQVAAALHGTPAALAGPGLIHEQQPAVTRRADPDTCRQRAAEQVNRVSRQGRQCLAERDRPGDTELS